MASEPVDFGLKRAPGGLYPARARKKEGPEKNGPADRSIVSADPSGFGEAGPAGAGIPAGPIHGRAGSIARTTVRSDLFMKVIGIRSRAVTLALVACGLLILFLGGPAAAQKDKALAHLIKDQHSLLTRLQTLTEKLERLSERLKREGQNYASGLLVEARKDLEEKRGAKNKEQTTKEILEQARRLLEGEQLFEVGATQERAVKRLEACLAILLDRKARYQLEAELAKVQNALDRLAELKNEQARLHEETKGASDPERAAAREALKQRLDELAARQEALMNATNDGRSAEERAARNRLEAGLTDLRRTQERLAAEMEATERLGDRSHLEALKKGAQEALERYARALKQALDKGTPDTEAWNRARSEARAEARDQARQAIEKFSRSTGRGEAARKAFEQAEKLEREGDGARTRGARSEARDAYDRAARAAEQAARHLEQAGSRVDPSTERRRLGDEQRKVQEALKRLDREMGRANAPESTRREAEAARASMERAEQAIRSGESSRPGSPPKTGEKNAGEKSSGQQNAGEKSSGQQNAGEKSAGQTGERKPSGKTGKSEAASSFARRAVESLQRALESMTRSDRERSAQNAPERKRVARKQDDLAKETKDLSEALQKNRERENASRGGASSPRNEQAANPAQPGGSESARHAREAARQMRQAARDLERGETSRARNRQQEAVDRLKKARDALDRRGPSSADPVERRRELALWQQRLEERARKLAEQVRKIGQDSEQDPRGRKAQGGESNRSRSLNRAERSMDRARREIDRNRMPQAEERQREAMAALNQAEREIKKRERDYMEMAQEEVIFRVGQILKEVLEEQKTINQKAVEEGAKIKPGRRRMLRSVRKAFNNIVSRQNKAKGRVEEVVGRLEKEEIEVFLFVLSSVVEDMGKLEDRLSQRPPDLSRFTRLLQADVVRNLKTVLDTLEEEARRRQQQRQSGKKKGGDDENQSGRRRLIPPTAELLMLKQYEVQVRERTEILQQAIAGLPRDRAVPKHMQDLLIRLGHQQGRIRDVLKKFMKSLDIPTGDAE